LHISLVVLVLIAIAITTLAIPIGKNSSNDTILAFASRSQSNNIGEKKEPIDTEDNIRPSIEITNPSPQSTIASSEITINGTAFDSGSGIQKVEVLAHIYPFDGVFNYQEANPISTNGDWSKWSISMPINNVGVYRILAHVIDNAGNENWDEVRVNIPFFADSVPPSSSEVGGAQLLPSPSPTSSSDSSMKKIALVIPTFTEAAYLPDSFYTFYNKYHSTPSGKNVIRDLDLLSTPIDYTYINPCTSVDIENLSMFTPTDPDDKKIIYLADHLRKIMPNNALVNIIRDEDIHDGYIFNSTPANEDNKNINNNSNIYDTLVIFHDEYATQSMYNNYKRFVSNGGTIIFVDANVFIAEVEYNKNNHTITLVKGHSWEFDGKSARKSVDERWFNENKEWVGGNFLVSSLKDRIYFSNNPFNYTHFEENYVNNPRNKILIDYDVVVPKNSANAGFHVASYELSYGKGRVIMTGLFGQKLISNNSFLKMLDSWILN
jgi:hypothetical protein